MFGNLKKGRIINPFAPSEINLTISINPQTGQAKLNSDVVVPATSVIGILSGVIVNLASQIEQEEVKGLRESLTIGDNKNDQDKDNHNNKRKS